MTVTERALEWRDGPRPEWRDGHMGLPTTVKSHRRDEERDRVAPGTRIRRDRETIESERQA